MAKLNSAYIGGGSTRAPGTVASFIRHHERFEGSRITLIDLDADRLEVV
ncbi:MAG TPA: glycoside hydrolase, partial [Deinococcales bacterium]|nr:glycoside hydrolase [Deinococcales bacterium]